MHKNQLSTADAEAIEAERQADVPKRQGLPVLRVAQAQKSAGTEGLGKQAMNFGGFPGRARLLDGCKSLPDAICVVGWSQPIETLLGALRVLFKCW